MKRKNLTRISAYLLIFTLLTFVLTPISTYAAESDEAHGVLSEYEANGRSDTQSTPSDSNEISESKPKKSFFTELFEAFEERLSEILSALAFAGSLIIMFCYKKGLIQVVTEGVKALSGGVKSISERTESIKTEAEELSLMMDKKLESFEKIINVMLNSIENTEKRLDELKESEGERAKLNTVMLGQIDMLYDIFNATSIPQYLKDSVGERISAMKAELKEASDESKT